MGVEVDVVGFDKLSRRLEQIKMRLPNAVAGTVRAYVELIERDARMNAPMGDGDLREAFGTWKRGMLGMVYNSAEHARPIEFGSDPHIITPSQADALAFYWEKIDQFVVLGSVDHPGHEAFNYFEEAIEKQWPRLVRDVKKNVNRVLSSV